MTVSNGGGGSICRGLVLLHKRRGGGGCRGRNEGMNNLRGSVDTKSALERVSSVDVRYVRLGNVGTIQEYIHSSGQQMVITSVLHCALFEAAINDTIRV